MRSPVQLAHDALDPLAKRAVRNEQSMVNEPWRARRLMLRDFALFAAVLVATFVDDTLTTGWLDIAVMLFVAVYVGYGAFQTTRKMIAYRSGWLDGRSQMVRALQEALDRGMTPDDWLEGEWARDCAVLGIPATPIPRPPDGSHDDI